MKPYDTLVMMLKFLTWNIMCIMHAERFKTYPCLTQYNDVLGCSENATILRPGSFLEAGSILSHTGCNSLTILLERGHYCEVKIVLEDF
jgi:hypothetical protein